MTPSRFTISISCGCVVFVPPDSRLHDRLTRDFTSGEPGDVIDCAAPRVVCPIHGAAVLEVAIINGTGAVVVPFLP